MTLVVNIVSLIVLVGAGTLIALSFRDRMRHNKRMREIDERLAGAPVRDPDLVLEAFDAKPTPEAMVELAERLRRVREVQALRDKMGGDRP